jgi:hypothetical protein
MDQEDLGLLRAVSESQLHHVNTAGWLEAKQTYWFHSLNDSAQRPLGSPLGMHRSD